MAKTLFTRRRLWNPQPATDDSGSKLYCISADTRDPDLTLYRARLAELKQSLGVAWPETASFAIFHRGAGLDYLVLGWWGNDNELFTRVSVHDAQGWKHDSSDYSFCVWDMEVLWFERNTFIETVYTEQPDLKAYRGRFLQHGASS